MGTSEIIRNCLHQMKKKLKYQNVKVRLNRHLKQAELSPAFSVIPANHLPPTLRQDLSYNCFTSDMLKNADNIQHDVLGEGKCLCSCHSGLSLQTPFFHVADCFENCGQSNEEYESYLRCRIHTLDANQNELMSQL